MTKLEELIYSLATVIVRYHDSQPKVNKLVAEIEPTLLRKRSREYAIGIMQNKEIQYDKQLEALIDACTKGYPDRKHLLAYILHEINFLKAQLDKKTPFTPDEHEDYQNQVTRLLLDFRQLLKTSKDKMYKVTYSELSSDAATSIDLSGLINNAWVGNALCNSGLLLIEEVLGRFHMTVANSDDEIREISVSLCMEHQNALYVPELQRQKLALEAQKLELESQISTLEIAKLQLESQKPALESEKLELKSQKSALGAQKLQIESQRSELEAQKKQLSAQKSTLDIQRQQVQSQQSELDIQRQQVKAQKSELEAHKKQLESQKAAQEAQRKELESQQSTQEVEKLQIESQKSSFGAQKLQLDSSRSELDAQRLQLSTQKSTLDTQRQQVHAQKSELEAQKLQVKTQKSDVEALKLRLESQKSELESRKADLVLKNEKQEATISTLESELEKTRAELQQIQSELQSYKEKKPLEEQSPQVTRRFPSYSPYAPFGGLGAFSFLNQRRPMGPSSRFFPEIAESSARQENSSDESYEDFPGTPGFKE